VPVDRSEEDTMPRTRKDEAPIAVDEPVYQARFVELGDYTVGFETFPVDIDPGPFFRGLPDDRCQCEHWGIVVTGSVTMRYADHEETYSEGDVYYIAPGHRPLVWAGASTIEFTPTAQFTATSAVVNANMAAAASSAS
jgi:hypothetical protein